MKNAVSAAFFQFALLSSLGAGTVQASVPAGWSTIPVSNGMQQPPGTWEFRPQREPRSMSFGPGNFNFPGRTFLYNYSDQRGWPGPKMSLFNQPQGMPFGQPQGMAFSQPQGRWPGQPANQPFSPRQSQAYGSAYSNGQTDQPPRIEVLLNVYLPYAQQSVIYTLRLVSDTNIKTVDVNLPQSENVIFRKLEGPKANVRNRRGKQEIVNEIQYTLTPLRDGYLNLPPVRVTGTMDQAQSGYVPARSGKPFDVQADQGLRLRVKSADASVQPWLPLQQLTLRAGLQDDEKIEAGKPLTLWIELSAVGAIGAQLPSLEDKLNSPDFRVYREETQTRESLSEDGHYLQGVRTEFFTLVPQHGGQLKLPEMRIPWWNVNTGTKEYASLPVKRLNAGGELGVGKFFSGLAETTSLFPAGTSSVFWIPLAGIFGLLIGYWLAVWLRNRKREEQRETLPLFPALERFRKPAAAALSRVSPALTRFKPHTPSLFSPVFKATARTWRRVQDKLVRLLPRSLRFWMGMRGVIAASDPPSLCQTLMHEANRHLDMPPQSPLPQIADRITEFQSERHSEQLQRLMRELDGAVYGDAPLDFARWKKEFKKEIRPKLFATGGQTAKRARRYLPELNPKTA